MIYEGRDHKWEGWTFRLDGSTHCPSAQQCDRRPDEEHKDYVRRHAAEHGLGDDITRVENAERNLGLYCFYYFHKYVFGNPTLCPEPFWESHEFISNWDFHPDDLETRLWDPVDPLPIDEAKFTLPPLAERKPGVFKRFKELEIPRGCQKTSAGSKAYATWELLRQYFLFKNPYFRIIVMSATSTLTSQSVSAMTRVWKYNKNIKRLYGSWLKRKSGKKERLGIYGVKVMNGVQCRWVREGEDADASGLTAFSVLYGGITSETTGQRADLYIFDDGQTKKNATTQAQREKVKNAFVEFVKQLDQHGRMLVLNTRKHLDDFAGEIKTPEWSEDFHIMHRRIEWVDPDTGEERLYYSVDGQGTERYSRRIIDQIQRLSAERDFWSEMMNWPLDPKKAIFKRDYFQRLDLDDCPIEVRYGIGREPTPEEIDELAESGRQISSWLMVDPAGMERQVTHGDDNALVGIRFDRYGGLYVVWMSSGRFDSDGLWDEIYAGASYVRPGLIDYEMPASELHIEKAYYTWAAEKSKVIKSPVILPMNFSHMPKSGKHSRIEQMSPIAKNQQFYITNQSGPDAEIRKFINQWIMHLMTDHDDYPDATSRILQWVSPVAYKAARAIQKEQTPPIRVDENGVTKIRIAALIPEMSNTSASLPWAQRGRRRHIA